ncbi:MAG: membrane dipeptidase [Candidatus Gracilibacteria bacterium]|nr:membrane dipeptidase [Candidatus Gracilibacteria bacterium]
MKIFDAHEDIAANIDLVTAKDFFKRNELFGESINPSFKGVNQSDFPRLLEGDVQLVFAVIFARNMEEAKNQYGIYEQIIENSRGDIFFVKSKEDLKRIEKGKVGFLLHMEGANPLSSIEDFEYFYNLGLRSIGITWRDGNAFYDERGLTALGIDLIKRLNKLPIICDLAHTTETLFWDIMKHYSKSPLVSHTAIMEVSDSDPRNINKRQIEAVCERGGVLGMIGINLMIGGDDVSDMIGHFRYMKENGYIDNVCIGSDFDGMVNPILTPITGFREASDFPILMKELEKNDFSEIELEKIAYMNLERFISKILG